MVWNVQDELPAVSFGKNDEGQALLPETQPMLEGQAEAALAKKAPVPRVRRAQQAGGEEGYGTAQSGDQAAPVKAAAPHPKSVEKRIGTLEGDVGKISSRIEDLFNLLEPKAKSPPARASAPKEAEVDPEVAKLGLTKEQEAAVAKMLDRPSRFKKDPPPTKKQGKKESSNDLLGETSGEDDEVNEAPKEEPAGQPVERAICLLTQILRAKEKSSDTLEDIYAGSRAATSSEGTLTYASSSKGGGLEALKRLLIKKPELFEKMIFDHMRRQNRGSAESQSSSGDPDPLFWAEHRSMIDDHPANSHWSWLMATILALLSETPPKIQEAKSRLLLGLAAAEQVAIDGGSWIYAGELLLLDQPVPSQSLSTHSARGLKEPHTTLVDAQLFQQITDKAVEDLVERKKKLNHKAPPNKTSGTPPAKGEQAKNW